MLAGCTSDSLSVSEKRVETFDSATELLFTNLKDKRKNNHLVYIGSDDFTQLRELLDKEKLKSIDFTTMDTASVNATVRGMVNDVG